MKDEGECATLFIGSTRRETFHPSAFVLFFLRCYGARTRNVERPGAVCPSRERTRHSIMYSPGGTGPSLMVRCVWSRGSTTGLSMAKLVFLVSAISFSG